MRRDGDLNWLRSSITYQEGESDHQVGEGLIQIKLFNRVMADLGESFLRRGVYVKSKYLSEFLTRFTPEFWKEFGTISKNQDTITNQELSDFVTDHNQWVKVIII